MVLRTGTCNPKSSIEDAAEGTLTAAAKLEILTRASDLAGPLGSVEVAAPFIRHLFEEISIPSVQVDGPIKINDLRRYWS